jgi:hypothetical protein
LPVGPLQFLSLLALVRALFHYFVCANSEV